MRGLKHAVHRVWCVAILLAAACGGRPAIEPMRLEGNRLTVTNTTPVDWTNVEIRLNTYYHVTAPLIAAGGRFDVPLDTFVAAFGQRFDYHRAQITDVRLTAQGSDGKPVDVSDPFDKGGLAGALQGLGGKR